MRIRRLKKRTGLTLIELMVSALIASILLVGLLGLSARMYAQKKRRSAASTMAQDQTSIYRLIEFDLSNSRFMTFSGSSLELSGYASKSSSGLPTQVPCTVRYELQELGNHRFLVRHQSIAGDSAERSTIIVAHETDAIDFLTFDDRSRTWKSILWSKDRDKRISIPDILRVQIFRFQANRPYLDQVFCLNVLRGTQ